jgi:NADP-dependent 3-hydroxy acid dehydrogenase YdfG
MKLAIADINEAKLKKVKEEFTKTLGAQNVIAVVTDVSQVDEVQKLKDVVYETWGEVGYSSSLLSNG